MGYENQGWAPEKTEQPPEKLTTKYRRCLKEMREELGNGMLETIKEYGLEADAAQRAVGKFYADFVTDAESFSADPSKWAEQVQAAGRTEEALARLGEIHQQLNTAWEIAEDEIGPEDQAWLEDDDEDAEGHEIENWILNGRSAFLNEAVSNFQEPLAELLHGDKSSTSIAAEFFRHYGQAAFAERGEPEAAYAYQESKPGRMEPFYEWSKSRLQSYPKCLRLNIEQVALCEKLADSADGTEYTLGEYEDAVKKLHLSALASTPTMDHESGHALDLDPANLNKLDTRLRVLFVEAALAEEARHSVYALETYAEEGITGGLEEDFADAWSLFLNAPEYLEGVTPKRHAVMAEIARSLEVDVVALRTGAKKSETERLGDAAKARAVFDVYGLNCLIKNYHAPVVQYNVAKWALESWRQLQEPCQLVHGDGHTGQMNVSRDEQGRLLNRYYDEPDDYDFNDPVYDSQGRLTSYKVSDRLFFVVYGQDGTPAEVLYEPDFKGAPQTIATFRTEGNQIVQSHVTPEGHAWDFVHELDTDGQLAETTVRLGGQPVCHRPMNKDAKGRLTQLTYLTLDGESPNKGEELTRAYAD
jgi:hypothetical protein